MTETTDLVPFEDDDELVVYDDDEPESGAEEIATEMATASEDLARLAAEAQKIASQPVEGDEPGGALVPANVSPTQAKARLAAVRANATKQRMALEHKQAEIREKQREMESLMHRQMALATEALAPIEALVKRLEEGIWMVNLYLGRDEEILMLRDGEPAPASEQVVIRQMVLAMDQESALDPEHDGIDASSIEEFDRWLQEDPAHVDQVAPETKCVVALRPRFESKRYDDPWKQRAVSEADRQTYFLIRNGDKLYRTWTEFNVGARLVPTADEFTSFFHETKRSYTHGVPDHRIPIKPGTRAWEEAEEASDARQRHYMRVGLILQGLVDRTTVFQPLPESGINFLDFGHNGKTWRFLMDAENTLTTGRMEFRDWQTERNQGLRKGMRIIGAFDRWYRSEDDPWVNSIWPSGAERPPTGELLMIEEEQPPDGILVRYKRHQRVYDKGTWQPREAKTRASCLLDRDARNIIAFDLVSEEEMVEYLNARTERHAYIEMFPLLKAAIRAKRAERAEEEPFRTMLAGVLARENGVEVAEAVAEIGALVEWWKLTNRNHRPLVGDEQSQAKAVRMIVAEHARRLKAKQASRPMVEKILRDEPGAIFVGRKRDGKHVALVPEDDDNVFVREIEYGVRSGKREQRWRLVDKARVARWVVAHQTERFDAWDLNATLAEHLTGPEIAAFTGMLTNGAKQERLVAVAYRNRKFHLWRVPEPVTYDEVHPLRGWKRAPEMERTVRSWSRKNRVAMLGRENTSYESGWADQVAEWDTRTKDGKPSQWRDSTRNLFLVLYHDPEMERRFVEQQARHKAVESKRYAMRETRDRLIGSISEQWVARREREEYERFLEDFLDPELWEGHRKALPAGTFAYPYKHLRERFGEEHHDALGSLVEHAVEQGIDLDGLSVWEAAHLHYPSSEWFGEPREVTVYDTKSETTSVRVEEWPKPGDIPEDLRSFRFKMMEPEEIEPDED